MDGERPSRDVDGVIITDELDRRPSRAPEHEAESRALSSLAEAMSREPDTVLQRLVEAAMELTHADSAGISLLQPGEDQDTFRWVATVGAWAPYRDGAMPRQESPCGEVVARGAVLLMSHPERAFPALLQGEPAIHEGLLAPFFIDNEPVGTVWVVKHDEDGRFEAEDARLLQSLARFAAAAQQVVLALDTAQTGLRETESRYTTLFETMGQGYALMELVRDASGAAVDQHYLEFNPAIERLLGVSAADAAGRRASEVFPDIEPVWTETFDRVVRSGQPQRIEHFFAHAQRWFEVHAYPAGGDRFIALYEDVTDRKQAEVALRENEERLRTLFDTMDEGFVEFEVLMSEDGRALDWQYLTLNRAFGRLSGLGDMTGKWASEFLPNLEPEWAERFAQVVTTGEPVRFDLPAAQLDRWFEVYVVRPGGPGSRRLMVVYNDIIERKRAEDALRENEARQAFLLKLSDALRPLADPSDIAVTACRLLVEQLGARRAQYALLEGEPVATGEIAGEYVRVGAPMPRRFPMAPYGEAVLTLLGLGRTLVLADAGQDPRLTDPVRDAFRAVEATATVSVPLVKGGRWVAALSLHDHTPRRWTDAEVALTEEVAERTWAAVERARAEAALAGSEERFRTMAESIEDVFYMTDLEAGSLDYLSPSYARVWGRPVEELTADLTRFFDTIHPDDRDWVAEGKAAQERGEPVTIEYRIIRPGGEVRWILDRSFPASDRLGKRSAGVASDITDRKVAETALRESEERTRLVVEGAQDYAIFTTDPQGRVVDWYTGAEAVFGFSAAEMQGQDFAILYTPQDRAAGAPETELEQARERGTAPNVRWHVHKGGGRIFMEGHVTPQHGPDGALTGFMKIGQDLTERRRAENRLGESERRFRTLIEGIPQLVWRAVDHGEWTWASPQWTAFTGQSDPDSHGWGWLDCVHPDDRQTARDAWARSKETGEFHADYRVREAATGGYRFFQTRATGVRDESGEIVEWLGTSTDFQDMRELQDRQTVLVAELQHRTRNLMSVVRSMFDKSRRGSETMGELSVTYGHRLGALARAQGLLSRLENGDRVSFDALIRTEMAAMGAVDAEGRGEQVTLAGPRGILLRSSTVQVFALALHELATNATKYGALAQPEGRLSVRWRLLGAADARRLRIEWLESGVDMPDAESPQRKGYGRELIERALPYQLGADTTYVLGADGVKCTIELPILDTVRASEAANV